MCLSTDPTKVEAVYIVRLHRYVHLLSNPKNANYVIISTKFYLSKIILELLRKKFPKFYATAKFTLHNGICLKILFQNGVQRGFSLFDESTYFLKKVNKHLKSADIFFQSYCNK